MLFVVLFFNLYCTRDTRGAKGGGGANARGAKGSGAKAAAAEGGARREAAGGGAPTLGERLIEFKPGCDVGDAAGFFRGKGEDDEPPTDGKRE